VSDAVDMVSADFDNRFIIWDKKGDFHVFSLTNKTISNSSKEKIISKIPEISFISLQQFKIEDLDKLDFTPYPPADIIVSVEDEATAVFELCALNYETEGTGYIPKSAMKESVPFELQFDTPQSVKKLDLTFEIDHVTNKTDDTQYAVSLTYLDPSTKVWVQKLDKMNVSGMFTASNNKVDADSGLEKRTVTINVDFIAQHIVLTLHKPNTTPDVKKVDEKKEEKKEEEKKDVEMTSEEKKEEKKKKRKKKKKKRKNQRDQKKNVK